MDGLGDEIYLFRERVGCSITSATLISPISDQGAADQSLVLSCELDPFTTIYLSNGGQGSGPSFPSPPTAQAFVLLSLSPFHMGFIHPLNLSLESIKIRRRVPLVWRKIVGERLKALLIIIPCT